jgi:cobalt-precorrin 5A hydrolase
MRIAVIAITQRGAAQAMRLAAALPGAVPFIAEKQRGPGQEGATYFGALKDAVAQTWSGYDGLVCLVSLGALVRTIAPHLRGKDVDPAVVCVDEAGRFSISVLSGHVGGANALAEAVAGALGCQPVVTTASDAVGTISVDILGREFGWTLEAKAFVTEASAAVVNGRPVAVIQECGEGNWWTRATPLPANIRCFPSIAGALAAGQDFAALLLISDRAGDRLAAELKALWPRTVVYRPRTLCLGMGCDAGVSLDEVDALLRQTFEREGLSLASVAGLASIDLKAGEPCLNALAQRLGVPFTTYTKDELNQTGTVSPANPLVEKHTGAKGVSEPAALRLAGARALAVTKVKGSRCTLAVARRGA